MRTSSQLIVVAAVAANLAVPVTADAQRYAGIAPPQGSLVRVGGTVCTVGFNDSERDLGYVSGDCGRDGDRVERVGFEGRELGTFRASGARTAGYSNNWGVIKWDTSAVGGNTTARNVADLAEMNAGDEVCYSEDRWLRTPDRSQNIFCGTFHERVGESFTVRMPKGTGEVDLSKRGMLWSPDKGFLGTAVPKEVGVIGRLAPDAYPVIWGNAPRDGEPVSEQQYREAYLAAAGVQGRTGQTGGPDGPGEKDLSSDIEAWVQELSSRLERGDGSSEPGEGSAEYSTGEIVGIVIGALAGLAVLAVPWLLGMVNITLPI